MSKEAGLRTERRAQVRLGWNLMKMSLPNLSDGFGHVLVSERDGASGLLGRKWRPRHGPEGLDRAGVQALTTDKANIFMILQKGIIY